MTLQELASIAEILGAIGVIASLVFVGWQIRENTVATKAHIHEQVTQTYLAFLNSAIANPEAYAAGIQATEADFSNLSAGEKTFFFGTALGFFKHFELMFVQNREGNYGQGDLGCMVRVHPDVFSPARYPGVVEIT